MCQKSLKTDSSTSTYHRKRGHMFLEHSVVVVVVVVVVVEDEDDDDDDDDDGEQMNQP